MSVVAVADLFGISGRRQELRAVLAGAERDAAGQPGRVRSEASDAPVAPREMPELRAGAASAATPFQRYLGVAPQSGALSQGLACSTG
jgi:hypothetical protein